MATTVSSPIVNVVEAVVEAIPSTYSADSLVAMDILEDQVASPEAATSKSR